MASLPSRAPSIPRPPPSPLRSASANIPAPSSGASLSSTLAATVPRRNTPVRPTTPPPPQQKTRARDLLRQHYGLGIGPPPPRPGNTQDPMDLSEHACTPDAYKITKPLHGFRFHCVRCEELLRTAYHDLDATRVIEAGE